MASDTFYQKNWLPNNKKKNICHFCLGLSENVARAGKNYWPDRVSRINIIRIVEPCTLIRALAKKDIVSTA